MTETTPEVDQLFAQLVISLQMGAMQQMGKITSPLTGKIERDLAAAKMSIDMLSMIEEKTAGNLTEDEKNLIHRLLYELRMNYVDEAGKPDESTDSKSEEPAAADEEAPGTDEGKSDPAGPDKTDA